VTPRADRRARPAIAIATATLAVLLLAAPVDAAPRDPRLQQVRSFAFGLGSGNLDGDVSARFAPFDLVVVDGQEARRSQVQALRGAGKLVLGYLSVGTIEPFRPWYRRARPYRLRDRFEEFNEFFAATSRRGYRRLIARRVAPALLRRGFDGLFLDNTDMIETHRRQTRGMRILIRTLARLVHRRGGLLFSQNGQDSIGPVLRFYDGWNREDVTWTYDFDRRRYVRVSQRDHAGALAALRRIGAAGLLVTATDYTAGGDAEAEAESVREACAAGALPFVSNIQLTRIPGTAYSC
jgi:hypothetical protein